MEKLTIQEEEAMIYIWELGSCFVKDIVAKYPQPAPPYTTVASIIKNLERKQYVTAARVGNTYQYTPAIRESEYKRTFMSGFVRNYFENSYKEMVSFFAKEQKISTKDLKDNSFNGKMLYIMRYDDNRYIDSTRVENQKFAFEGRTAIPSFCRIDAGRNYGNFILDEGTIKVNLYTHLPTGTKLNEAFNKTIATVDSIRKKGFAHLAELKKEKPNAEDWQPVWAEYYEQKIRPSLLGYLKQQIISNKDNGVGEYAFRDYSMACNTDEMDALQTEIGNWLNSLKTVQAIKARFEALKSTAVGKPFVDIAGEDTEGKETRLSDFVGKGNYVLVDMWASWCAPCREEIPNLAEIYNTYKDKGLVILGIATWDKKDRIIKAIEDLNMTWPQLLDTRQKVMELYGVNGIPHIILFAPDGTIVARNLRGDEMKQKVAEIMKDK